jgi:hypothetical protein
MTVNRLLWLSMWFLLYKLWYKRLRSKYKYNLFIVLWPRTKVCHHQSWFPLCTFIVTRFAHCKLNYIKGSCWLLWLVYWWMWFFLCIFCLSTLHSISMWSCLLSSVFAWGQVIRLKRIYNFWCSMLVYTPFALCFVTLRGIFMHFLELTY